MRKIREALRLRSGGFSGRRVAQSLSLGRATISEYFRRADVEGLSWPLPTDLSDTVLEQRLFPRFPGKVRRGVPQPDWVYVHAELRRKGVTLSLLRKKYRGVHPPLGTLLGNALSRCPSTHACMCERGQSMGTATGTVNSIRDGKVCCRLSCANHCPAGNLSRVATLLARACLSTMQATPWMLSALKRAQCAQRRSG